MKYVKVGNMNVSVIGIGTWCVGGGIHLDTGIIYADYDNEKKEIEAIKYSIEKGQNHIDTAQMYGAGHTEEVVGKAIKGINRKKLFIASKIWKSHVRKSSVVPAVEDMLRRLGTKYLDLLYMHSPRVVEPMVDYISGMNKAVDMGLVKHLGVSNFNLTQLKKAVKLSKHPVIANQMHYNILYKKDVPKAMLDYCRKNGIYIIAYQPVERKLLADECDNKVVLELSRKYKKTPAQIAINWLVSQENVLVIPKAVSKKHINENLKSLDFEMSQEDLAKLDSIPDFE
jgi:diketogulonate reductase-like aldo/keto reductase